MSHIIRKKHTGEPGPGGQFGSKQNSTPDTPLQAGPNEAVIERFRDSLPPNHPYRAPEVSRTIVGQLIGKGNSLTETEQDHIVEAALALAAIFDREQKEAA